MSASDISPGISCGNFAAATLYTAPSGNPIRRIVLLTAGTLAAKDVKGNVLTITGLPAGYVHDCAHVTIETGTTATGVWYL